MILIGGEPGIGKSTLLLQVAAKLEGSGRRTLYVSGEESPLQVKLRADRLTDNASDVSILGETLLETIIATGAAMGPSVLIVDSIQTVFTADLEGAPGSVGQVRECAARLMRFAKESGTSRNIRCSGMFDDFDATGRFTSTPCCSIGAATMKMISSTSITSTSGTTLISESDDDTRRPRPRRPPPVPVACTFGIT
jgi:hypothetical protein